MSGQATGGETRAPADQRIGAAVRIENATLYYGSVLAVDSLSLDIAAGEFLTLLGPSGSGKTTTMMAIAGFASLASGQISIGGRRVDELPAHRRDIGIVFQHLALFPHMNVADNIAFPLRMRGTPEAEIRERVAATLALVRLAGFERRLPHELSGGQQQRVALARAVVFRPPVLLLDEPLGALDRKLRDNMQLELKQLHRALGITIIHVTHDQSEALAISDRIAVMNNGRIQQVGTPHQLYETPADSFVADFLGESNFIPVPNDASKVAMVRPESLRIGDAAASCPNTLSGVVREVTYAGSSMKLHIAVSPELTLIAALQSAAVDVGSTVTAGWMQEDVRIFPADASKVQ